MTDVTPGVRHVGAYDPRTVIFQMAASRKWNKNASSGKVCYGIWTFFHNVLITLVWFGWPTQHWPVVWSECHIWNPWTTCFSKYGILGVLSILSLSSSGQWVYIAYTLTQSSCHNDMWLTCFLSLSLSSLYERRHCPLFGNIPQEGAGSDTFVGWFIMLYRVSGFLALFYGRALRFSYEKSLFQGILSFYSF